MSDLTVGNLAGKLFIWIGLRCLNEDAVLSFDEDLNIDKFLFIFNLG